MQALPPHFTLTDPVGYVHIDVKHLPQMPDETKRTYLFLAIDRATKMVCVELRHS